MALIVSLEEAQKQRTRVHPPVSRATAFILDDGPEKFVQVDTYGSEDREYSSVPSQTFQLNKASAKQLVELINRAFPDLK